MTGDRKWHDVLAASEHQNRLDLHDVAEIDAEVQAVLTEVWDWMRTRVG
jgi:hypothetical protein